MYRSVSSLSFRNKRVGFNSLEELVFVRARREDRSQESLLGPIHSRPNGSILSSIFYGKETKPGEGQAVATRTANVHGAT